MNVVKENTRRKVDSMGRVSIPKSIRDRFELNNGDEVEFYTIEGMFVGFKKVEDEEGEEVAVAIKVLERMGLEVPEELLEKV